MIAETGSYIPRSRSRCRWHRCRLMMIRSSICITMVGCDWAIETSQFTFKMTTTRGKQKYSTFTVEPWVLTNQKKGVWARRQLTWRKFLKDCHGHEDGDTQGYPFTTFRWQHKSEKHHAGYKCAWKHQVNDVVSWSTLNVKSYHYFWVRIRATGVLDLRSKQWFSFPCQTL